MNEQAHRFIGLTNYKLLNALRTMPNSRPFELANASGAKRGSTYIALQRLEQDGFVESDVTEEGNLLVRRWRITETGKLELERLRELFR